MADLVHDVGQRREVDVNPAEAMRVVQLTPPGSACSIVFGTGMGGISDMQPGPVKGDLLQEPWVVSPAW